MASKFAEDMRRNERVLAAVGLAVLAIGAVAVLKPFFSGLIFAVVLALGGWPAFERLERALKGRATLAAALATGGLAATLLVPLLGVAALLANDIGRFVSAFRRMLKERPSAPDWVSDIPILGEWLKGIWDSFRDGTLDVAQAVSPYAERIGNAVLSSTASVGGEAAQLIIGLLITFFLFRDGDAIAARLRVLVHRLAGPSGEHLLQEAHGTMTGVLYGILGTALVQGGLCLFAFWLAGVPGAIVLGVAAAVLSVIPAGVGLVLWSAALWLLAQGEVAWAIFLVVWGVLVVGTAESFIKAAFISRSSRLPFVLILLGLVGGAVAGGFVGIFWGPVILAVAFRLLSEWTKTPPADHPAAPVEAGAAAKSAGGPLPPAPEPRQA